MLTYKRATEVLSYDAQTGIVTWKKSTGPRAFVGAPVGCKSRKGYLEFQVDGGSYKVHRVAWLIHTGQWPVDQIDHINGDKADNRIANLREATNAQNCQNRRRKSTNTSGVTGVTYVTRDKRWVAQINIDGKQQVIGRFADKASAVERRLVLEKTLYPYRWAA